MIGGLSPLARSIVYTLLVLGSLVFAFPFAWLASTSVKVDRELLAQEGSDIDLMPTWPEPRERSPFIDEQYFADLSGPHQDLLLPELERLVDAHGFEPPRGIDRSVARRQIARGVYRKLRKVIPDSVWDRDDPGKLLAAARKRVHAELIRQVFSSVYRELRFGALRAKSIDRQVVELGAARPISGRIVNQTPAAARLEDHADGAGPAHAVVRYDFSHSDELVFSAVADLPFDTRRLKRLELDIRPDDSWHELTCEIELGDGRRLESTRAIPLANFTSITLAWQPPSRDDRSTKIKNYVLLEGADAAALNGLSKRQLRVRLRLTEVERGAAIMQKLRRNYDRVADHMPFSRYLRVSVFLVAANIVLTLLASSLVAYAFARLSWPGRDFCFVLMLATMMVPPQVTMIPHFLIWKNLGAYNTLAPLWIGPAFGSAFFIFLLRQFMKGIPRDLEDAARIDGCGFLRIYFHIILPLIKPSLAAIAIFTFMGTWNDFMGPLIYLADQRLYPIAFGLYAFAVQVGNDPALTMAAALLMTLPVILVFFFAQKYFIQGVTLTGMKG